MYNYGLFALLYGKNQHNTVKKIFTLNKKQKKKKKTWNTIKGKKTIAQLTKYLVTESLG